MHKLICLIVTWVLLFNQAYAAISNKSIHKNNQLNTYLTLNTVELEHYNQRIKDIDRNDFTANLVFDYGSKTLSSAVEINIRGRGSIHCDRKSFSVNFPGDKTFPALPHSVSNKYLLISMCLDESYIRTTTVLNIWKKQGLLPLEFKMTELFINDKTQGIYLLIEKPVDALARKFHDIQFIFRRHFNNTIEGYDLKYATIDRDLAHGDLLHAFLNIEELDTKALAEKLAKTIDLEQFITHLAIAAILKNGDYIDELFLIQKKSQTHRGYHYSFMSWDPEDTFDTCHYNGQYAYKDPWDIAYCVESKLGKLILKNPLLYKKFIAKIEKLINQTLSIDNFSIHLNQTVQSLDSFMKRTNTANAMLQFKKQYKTDITHEIAMKKIIETANKITRIHQNQTNNILKKITHYKNETQH